MLVSGGYTFNLIYLAIVHDDVPYWFIDFKDEPLQAFLISFIIMILMATVYHLLFMAQTYLYAPKLKN